MAAAGSVDRAHQPPSPEPWKEAHVSPEILPQREITLTQGKVAIVDATDYESLAGFRWYAWRPARSRTWYAGRNIANGTLLMHRQIMSAPRGFCVDHRDGDGLKNTRENLRLATHRQNLQNRQHLYVGKTSRFLGVCWDKSRNKWLAQIRAGQPVTGPLSRRIHLGRYADEADAARAYDVAALEYFGDFASFNFPREARHA